MAKITNIKTRDETVHPIALPFAICSNTAGATIKTLAFSGGDTPTELVNGQQIMVQFSEGSQTESTFSVKITDGASITYTVPVVLNSSNSSIIPHVGAGAVVNLTYNDNNFYISNAAALTGFEVPTDVTLATITNSGGIIENVYNNRGTIDLIYTGRRGVVYDIQNSGIVSNIKNLNGEMDSGGSIIMFDNASRGQVEQINNDGTVSSVANTGIIDNIYNTITGIIGVPDSTGDGIFNGSSATIHYIENNGKIVTFKNNGTTGNSDDATTGVQNTGNLYNITNSSNGTIHQLINSADIKTITIGTAATYTGPGLINQITNWSGDTPYSVTDYTPTKGINNFTNKGRIKTLENTGDIGFAGTLPACPAGYSTDNYYDANTGIKNTGIIHNIKNDYAGHTPHSAVIRHIANYGGNGTGGISLFENGGDLSYLVNVPSATGASDIPGGNIGEIINNYRIGTISNEAVNDGNSIRATIAVITSVGIDSTRQAYIGVINNAFSTINEINNGWSGYQHGHIETINNWSSEGAGGGINNIYNQPGGVIDDIYNGSTLSSTLSVINSITNNGRIGDTTYGGYGISNTGTINNIQNSGTITLIGNNNKITSLNNSGTITSATNTGIITTLTNQGSINTLTNYSSHTITTLINGGCINTLMNTKVIDTLDNQNAIGVTIGRINNLFNVDAYYPLPSTGLSKSYSVDTVLQNGYWTLDPSFSLVSSTILEIPEGKDLAVQSTASYILGQSKNDSSVLTQAQVYVSEWTRFKSTYIYDPYDKGSGHSCLLVVPPSDTFINYWGASNHSGLVLNGGIYRLFYAGRGTNNSYKYCIVKLRVTYI